MRELPDQEPLQSFAARTSLDSRPRGNDDATAGELLLIRTPDDNERKAERTIGTAAGFWREPPNPSADVAEVTPPPLIEDEDAPTTGSLANGSLANRALDDLERNVLLGIGTAAGFWREPLTSLALLVGVVVLVTLGLIEILLRSQQRRHHVRPVDWDIKFINLRSKTPAELVSFAEENGVENASTMPKQELLFAILKQLRAPNEVAADPSPAVAADPSPAVDPSPASGLALAIAFWVVLLAPTAGWFYALGAGTSKLVSWLFF